MSADRVLIGAVSATFVDSRLAMPQLLGSGEPIDFLVFDCLAEGVMSILFRAKAAGQPGWVTDFVEGQVSPYLDQIARRGIKVVANAGGLDPEGCADALRRIAADQNIPIRIASISGDDLSHRIDELVQPGTPDMFEGASVRERLDRGDKPLCLTAYTGAFPIAAALDAGADIVVAGRCVDSATTLGALIHRFGWDAGDFDRLAAGTLIGHLIECTTQATGGTFTDWQDVPDWANIGFPIAACSADGTAEIYKPSGTGGLVSRATLSEQMLYEVSDPARYIVPDVICDFSDVSFEETSSNRVAVSGARGRGRPETLKATLAWDQGWRASALIPIVGLDAHAKAERLADAMFERAGALALAQGLSPYAKFHRDVIGDEGPGMGRVVCRLVADHPDARGAALFAREQSSLITSTAPGVSVPLGTQVRPLTRIASFALDRSEVSLAIEVDGEIVEWADSVGGSEIVTPPPAPPEPASTTQECTPKDLVDLAWVRSGDKGNLFNVAVIARRPELLPWLWNALTPEAVSGHYASTLGVDAQSINVERYPVPGIDAMNLVVEHALDGGMLASAAFDPAAKGMGQLLLTFRIPVPDTAIEQKKD